MKNKILGLIVIIFLITTSTLLAQSTNEIVDKNANKLTEGVSVLYNDAKAMVPKLEAAVISLATGLKLTANKVWDILVKQQFVYSLGYLLITIAAIVNWILLWKYTLGKTEQIEVTTKFYKEGYENLESRCINTKTALETKFIYGWFAWIHIPICLLLSIYSYLHFNNMLTGFINPEYGAMKQIVEIAVQLKQ